jgi:hypothetical protein
LYNFQYHTFVFSHAVIVGISDGNNGENVENAGMKNKPGTTLAWTHGM